MDGIYLIGLVVLAGLATLLVRRRQRRPLILTNHSLHCPAYDGQASVAVRTDAAACPSRRHLDVTACSLLPSTPLVSPARRAYLADLSPAGPYPYEVGGAPHHADGVCCAKTCLAVLNAEASGPRGEPIRCTSGMSDSYELARQTQTPAIMRAMWYHSV